MNQKQITQEKQLYGLFLDLDYSVEGFQDRISDLQDELKDTKARLKKATASRDKVEVQYEKLNGCKPRRAK